MCVRTRFVFFYCWLSCVVEDIHTSKCQIRVPVSALYTHLSVCKQARITRVSVRACARVCVFGDCQRFLKQHAALQLLREKYLRLKYGESSGR